MADGISVPIKTFDGKRYHLYAVYRSENKARGTALAQRNSGMNARVEVEHVYDRKTSRVVKEFNVWVRKP